MSATAIQPTMTDEAKLLFMIASRVPCLARMMGIVCGAGEQGKIKVGLLAMQRSWLVPHPIRGAAEMTFDPVIFSRVLKVCSDGERHCVLWLLNVWNPSFAKLKGWNYDMFAALPSLDSENRLGIAEWLVNPRFP